MPDEVDHGYIDEENRNIVRPFRDNDNEKVFNVTFDALSHDSAEKIKDRIQAHNVKEDKKKDTVLKQMLDNVKSTNQTNRDIISRQGSRCRKD